MTQTQSYDWWYQSCRENASTPCQQVHRYTTDDCSGNHLPNHSFLPSQLRCFMVGIFYFIRNINKVDLPKEKLRYLCVWKIPTYSGRAHPTWTQQYLFCWHTGWIRWASLKRNIIMDELLTGVVTKETLSVPQPTSFQRRPLFTGKTWPWESSKSFLNICQTQTVSWSWTTDSENRFQGLTLSLRCFKAIWVADSWVYKGLGTQTGGSECRTLLSVCSFACVTTSSWLQNKPRFVCHQWNRQPRVLEGRFPAEAC